MCDVLLIQPPVRDFYLTAKRTIPYGLLCMASVLKKDGVDVDIFDALATPKSKHVHLPDELSYLTSFFGEKDVSPFALFHGYKHFGYSYEYIGKIIKEKRPKIIGISSLFTTYFNEALTCAKIAKTVRPECIVVMGGHHPTALPESVMTHPEVDYCLTGEGEASFPVFVRKFLKNKTLDDVPGIVMRKDNNYLHMTHPAMMENLDNYPLPAFEMIKSTYYRRKKRGSISVMTSRGCPLKCAYCCMGNSPLSYRKKSVETVMDEIKYALSMDDVGFIDIEDEHLTLNRKWFMALLDQLTPVTQRKQIELRAMNGLFPPSLDKEMIIKMKAAGFNTLNLSVGSTSAAQLKRFNRPDVRHAYEEVLTIAEKQCMETVSYIIVGAPGQTALSSVQDMIYFMKKPTLLGVSVYYPAPGSRMYKTAEKNDSLPETFSMMRSTALPTDKTTSRLEAATLLRLGRIINFIKFLRKKGISLPTPKPYEPEKNCNGQDKIEAGLKLLQCFFQDGIIRGLTPSGSVFDHKTAVHLTHPFIEAIN